MNFAAVSNTNEVSHFVFKAFEEKLTTPAEKEENVGIGAKKR